MYNSTFLLTFVEQLNEKTMGCWNGTCMVSRLPIIAGERVKLVFLHNPYGNAQVSGMSAYCYSSDILMPAFLPISGEYNDYGGIENIDKDWNYQTIESVFKAHFGDELKVDREKVKNWNLEHILEGIERGNLQYFSRPKLSKQEAFMLEMSEKSSTSKYKPYQDNEEEYKKMLDGIKKRRAEEPTWQNANLSFVFIREDIYNAIIETMRNEQIYTDIKKKGTKEKNYKYIPLHEYLNLKFEKSIESMKELNDMAKGMGKDSAKLSFLLNHNQIFNASYASSGSYFDNGSAYTKYLNESITDEGVVATIYKSWEEFEYITSYVNSCRIGWMVQSGAGSQNQDWERHKAIAQKVVDICNEKMREEE